MKAEPPQTNVTHSNVAAFRGGGILHFGGRHQHQASGGRLKLGVAVAGMWRRITAFLTTALSAACSHTQAPHQRALRRRDVVAAAVRSARFSASGSSGRRVAAGSAPLWFRLAAFPWAWHHSWLSPVSFRVWATFSVSYGAWYGTGAAAQKPDQHGQRRWPDINFAARQRALIDMAFSERRKSAWPGLTADEDGRRKRTESSAGGGEAKLGGRREVEAAVDLASKDEAATSVPVGYHYTSFPTGLP